MLRARSTSTHRRDPWHRIKDPVPLIGSSQQYEEWLRYVRLLQQASNPLQSQYICLWQVKENQSGVCGFSGDRTTVKRHVDTTHLQNRAFVCHVCGWTFAQRSLLEAHISTHSSVVTGLCPHCGQTFADPAKKYQHLVQQHGYVPNA
ncbi:hypothetical protein AcW2_006631 [Taiwanofungus camphoratus]|nr:hypothetical protein AcW2_006631 [Antrodia cinnamomea]